MAALERDSGCALVGYCIGHDAQIVYRPSTILTFRGRLQVELYRYGRGVKPSSQQMQRAAVVIATPVVAVENAALADRLAGKPKGRGSVRSW